jgi:hypothetical protein
MMLTTDEMMMIAQSVRQSARDLYDEGLKAKSEIAKEMFNDHADRWVKLAEKVDQIIEQEEG